MVNHTIDSALQPIINQFDCLGWIPTIRGGLSLQMLDDTAYIMGDADKYLVEIKDQEQYQTKHYIAATSLITFEDSKHGPDYCNTFRFIFRGTINEQIRLQEFIENYNLVNSNDFLKLCKEDGVLLGRISVLTDLTKSNTLTTQEATMLKHISHLRDLKKSYVRNYAIKSVDFSDLKNERERQIFVWEQLENTIKQIEENANEPRLVFLFDVFLTRDGLLFLKSVSNPKAEEYYCKAGTASDFRQQIPISRVFKTAMNFVKYLFHSNYHHNEKHDTFLPVSNLHPICNQQKSISFAVRHQLEAFLYPVTRLKRNGFKDYSINPNGILLYAESFLHVCKRNNLLSAEDEEYYCSLINQFKEEVNVLVTYDKAIIESFFVENNIVSILSVILVFVLALIDIYQFYGSPLINGIPIPKNMILFLGIFLGILVKIIASISANKRRFKLHCGKTKQFGWKNSNIKRKRFSLIYIIKLGFINLKLYIGERVGSLLLILIDSTICVMLLYFCRELILRLL